MLENIRIWRDDIKTVHYEVDDEKGSPFIHGAIPVEDWKAKRRNMIQIMKSKYPEVTTNNTVVTAGPILNLLVVLNELIQEL